MENKELIYHERRLQALKDVLVKSFEVSGADFYWLKLSLEITLNIIVNDFNYEKIDINIGRFTKIITETTTKTKEQTYDVICMFVKFIKTCIELRCLGLEDIIKKVMVKDSLLEDIVKNVMKGDNNG